MASGKLHVGAATIAPVGSNDNSLSVSAERSNDLAPAPHVSALGYPTPPELDGRAKQVLGLADAGATCQRLFVGQSAQNECHTLALA